MAGIYFNQPNPQQNIQQQINNAPIRIHNLNNINNFITKIQNISNQIKVQVNFTDIDKKSIDDIFTKIINEYMLVTPTLLNSYLGNVINLFKDFDSSNLSIPLQNNNIEIRQAILTPNYNIDNNRCPINNNTMNGYFVFKGGNVIKIWTLKKYMEKLYGISSNNIENLLKIKIPNQYDSNILNSYSDYDFQYYINDDNGEFDDTTYKLLLEHIIYRLTLLRSNLIVEFQKYNNLIQFLTKYELHCGIQKYFENNGNIMHNRTINNITFMQRIRPSNYVTSTILTNYNPPCIRPGDSDCNDHPSNTLYKLSEQSSMNISFNNTIITSTGTDFDLFRIKLKFNANNNYKKDKFSSELFDLSVLRPSDASRVNFCDHINENTNIITFNDHLNQPLSLRIYSIIYTLKDLLLILFSTNQPYNTIFLWSDKKYDKRIVRLGFLYASYLDELKHKIRITHNGLPILISNLTCRHIITHVNNLFTQNLPFNNNNSYKYLLNYFIGHFIILIRDDFEFNKNNFEIRNRQTTFNDVINSCIIRLINYMKLLRCNKRFINHIINNEINVIITNYVRQPLNTINIANFRNQITNINFYKFMLSTYLIYIKSIFVDIDILWCSDNYYNRPNNPDIDIWEFKVNSYNFIKLFVKYYIIGLQCQSNILQIMIPPNILRYYQRLLNVPNNILIGGSNKQPQNKTIIISYIIKNKYLFKNLLKYIAYSEYIYEYSEKNKYTLTFKEPLNRESLNRESLNRESLNRELITNIEFIPKTIKYKYYNNNILLDNHIKHQEILLEKMFIKKLIISKF